nr:ferrous iron transport protein A [Lachnospiraceae bacterium]MCR5716124.1 ferrous iron transport protein A [Lachnospiraceae bacterium]
MKLGELSETKRAVVSNLNGDHRFISRITSIGLTPGCQLQVIKNDKNR